MAMAMSKQTFSQTNYDSSVIFFIFTMYEQLTPHKCFNPNYIYTYNICMCLMIAESESDKKQ